ncbi:hypothetical protein, partial [Pseudomonas sp. NY15354]|uniref:cytidine deaminase-like fold-containing protein n=1 Tax=Pseudomonas sp. NY15354 TaxID=3400351 RepID=UPI003A83634B
DRFDLEFFGVTLTTHGTSYLGLIMRLGGVYETRGDSISDRVTAKSDASGKVLPNGNMADAHAEIGVIQQAYAAGKTMGASMELTVSGKAVCGYCRGDIAAMAEKSGLTSLTVKEAATGKTLYWQPGMRALREQD